MPWSFGNIGCLSYVGLPNIGALLDTTKKLRLVNITTDLFRKVLKYWQASQLSVADRNFPKY